MENNDRIIKCLAYEGKVSIICADTTYLVEQERMKLAQEEEKLRKLQA